MRKRILEIAAIALGAVTAFGPRRATAQVDPEPGSVQDSARPAPLSGQEHYAPGATDPYTPPARDHLSGSRDPYPASTRETRSKDDPNRPDLMTGVGMSLTAGGGVTNFTNSYLNSITDPGGAWSARFTLGTRSIIAVEAGYIGSAQKIRAIGLDSSALLMSNGLEGDLRLNLSTGEVQPYLFGGAAWKRCNIVNNSQNNSALRDRNDVLELPIGVGLAWRYRGFVADGRFDYRPSFYDDLAAPAAANGQLLNNPSPAGSGLNNWNVTARIGWEF